MFTRILIPTDGSKLAVTAAENAVQFAGDIKASVVFVYVVEPFHLFTTDSNELTASRDEYDRLSNEQAAQVLTEMELFARHHEVANDVVQVQSEQVHQAIIETAILNGCDLIAMGSHGRGGVAGLILGSIANKVLSHSRIPVLIYR